MSQFLLNCNWWNISTVKMLLCFKDVLNGWYSRKGITQKETRAHIYTFFNQMDSELPPELDHLHSNAWTMKKFNLRKKFKSCTHAVANKSLLPNPLYLLFFHLTFFFLTFSFVKRSLFITAVGNVDKNWATICTLPASHLTVIVSLTKTGC